MITQTLNQLSFLDKLSNEEENYQKQFSSLYLAYLGNSKPSKKQILEMQTLLGNVCFFRPLILSKRLSAREKQCLRLTSFGKTLNEIAKIMQISSHTVNQYKRNILKKLSSKNMSQAIAKAIFHGLLVLSVSDSLTT